MEESPISTAKTSKAFLDPNAPEDLPVSVASDELAVLIFPAQGLPGPMASGHQAVLSSTHTETAPSIVTRGHQVALRADEGTAPFRPKVASAEPEVLQLRVLYLFAGAKRKGDMKFFLTKLGKYVQKAFKHSSHAVEVEVLMDEIDIVRGKAKGNLLNPKLRMQYLAKVSAGNYDVVLGSPPCGTLSRARRTGDGGPRPLRSVNHPRGFPWLSGKARASVLHANTFIYLCAHVLRVQAKQDRLILLEHPEDLGRSRSMRPRTEAPASIWRWPQVTTLLAQINVRWGALYQQDFGTEFLKPTRLMTNIQESDQLMQIGDPKFDEDGSYIGPLVWRQGAPPLKGKEHTGAFKTSKAAAWPPQMCRKIAELIWRHIIKKSTWTGRSLRWGESVLEKSLPVQDQVPMDDQAPKEVLDRPQGSTTRTRPRRITSQEIEQVRRGTLPERAGVYVGRVPGPNGKCSKWANKFKIGIHGSRAGVIKLYGEWLVGLWRIGKS